MLLITAKIGHFISQGQESVISVEVTGSLKSGITKLSQSRMESVAFARSHQRMVADSLLTIATRLGAFVVCCVPAVILAWRSTKLISGRTVAKKPKTPTPEEVRAARLKWDLTQKDAAALIGYTRRAWQDWESGERRMRKVLLSLFNDIAAAKYVGRLPVVPESKGA